MIKKQSLLCLLGTIVVPIFSFCQKTIVIADSLTKVGVSGATIRILDSPIVHITDETGRFSVSNDVKLVRLVHPHYITKLHNITDTDTVYLNTIFQKTQEVNAVNESMKYLFFNELNEVISQQRNNKKVDSMLFAMFFQTTQGEYLEERTKLIYETQYSPKLGHVIQIPNVLAGEFELDENSTFVNNSIHLWLTSMHPFMEQNVADVLGMPSHVKKITAKEFDLFAQSIEMGNSRYRIVHITRKADSVSMQFFYRVADFEIKEVRLIDAKETKRNLFDLQGNKKSIRNLNVVYQYHNNQPEFIQFSFATNTDAKQKTTGYAKSIDRPKSIGKIKMIGNLKGANTYAQISILPTANTKIMDSVFQTISSQYFDTEKPKRQSSNPEVQQTVLNDLSGMKEWGFQRLNSSDAKSAAIYSVKKNSWITSKIQILEVENWRVAWPLQKVVRADGEMWVSSAAVWGKNSKFNTYFKDQRMQAMLYNLVFDYYEVQRRKTMVHMGLKTDKELLAHFENSYDQTRFFMNQILREVGLSYLRFAALYQLNQKSKTELMLDNFRVAFEAANREATDQLELMEIPNGLISAAQNGMSNDATIKTGMLEEAIELLELGIEILNKNGCQNADYVVSLVRELRELSVITNQFGRFCSYLEKSGNEWNASLKNVIEQNKLGD